MSAITHTDVPRLILDLDSENDTHLKGWRNDTTAVVVQTEESQSLDGGEDWFARSVVCFVDTVIRSRGSETDASRKVQGACGVSKNVLSRLQL